MDDGKPSMAGIDGVTFSSQLAVHNAICFLSVKCDKWSPYPRSRGSPIRLSSTTECFFSQSSSPRYRLMGQWKKRKRQKGVYKESLSNYIGHFSSYINIEVRTGKRRWQAWEIFGSLFFYLNTCRSSYPGEDGNLPLLTEQRESVFRVHLIPLVWQIDKRIIWPN